MTEQPCRSEQQRHESPQSVLQGALLVLFILVAIAASWAISNLFDDVYYDIHWRFSPCEISFVIEDHSQDASGYVQQTAAVSR